ncbi:AAA family ATPase, partial [Arthrospira platensis SPKY2]
ERFVTSRVEKGELSKLDIINILKKADFHISDLIIQEDEKEIPEGLIDFLKAQMKDSPDAFKKLEEKGKISTIKIEFEHTVNQSKYNLPIEMESQGTRRFFGFSGLLALLIKNSTAFTIDELESSLHPDLYIHFILSFLLNTDRSQIIAT